MDLFEQNSKVVSERWPEVWAFLAAAPECRNVQITDNTPEPTLLIDGIHISSCYDKVREARLQASLIPETETAAWMYDAGVGDLPRELLQRDRLKQLNIMILSPMVFNESIKYFDQRSWLSDPRVELHIPANQATIQHPFCAVPTGFVFADESAQRIRDILLLELSTPFINKRILENETYINQIRENYPLIEQDSDVQELFGTLKSASIYVTGAGPTLANHYDLLKGRNDDSLLIAVDAALRPLFAQGITPDYVVTMDGNHFSVTKFFDVDMRRFVDTGLVYFPVVPNDALKDWSGKRYTAYSASPLYTELATQFPRGKLFSAGSVIHAAVDLAVKMGGSSIKLLGADFSYPYEHTHVEGATNKREVKADIKSPEILDGHGRSVRSAPNFIGYLRDLEQYIGLHPEVEFINMSRDGAKIAGTSYID